MDPIDRKKYYLMLRDYCESLGTHSTKVTGVQKIISKLAPNMREFDIEVRGEENLKYDGAIILSNHSNSHDVFVDMEVFSAFQLPATYFAEKKGLSVIERKLFEGARATMIDRLDKESSNIGLYDFTGKMMNGDNGIICGESTWNLHPTRPMQRIKPGATKVGAISGKPIIPEIKEYIEVPYLCEKEKDMFKKCVIVFGKPIYIRSDASLIQQTAMLQGIMEEMRRALWKEFGIKRDSLSDIDPQLYVNHTGLKVYGGKGQFDYDREKKCLSVARGEEPEFMYTIDEEGNFVPGELTRDTLNKTLQKKKY